MKHNLTVDKAISRGQLIAVALPLFCLIGTILLSVAVFKPNAYSVIGGIVAGFLMSWLAWSITITYWRIWAFENVRNVHQLRKRAVQEKIIWREGHFFERTEIRNTQQKEKIRQLNLRFNEDDVFYDDASVPDATYIYFSKYNSYSEIVFGVLIIVAAVYFYFSGAMDPKSKFLIYAGPVIGLLMFYQGFKKLRNIKPQLIIDDEGIRVAGKSLIDWESIDDTNVVVRNKEHILEIYHLGGLEDVEIQKLDTNAKKLRHLLDIYRVRHAKNKAVTAGL